MWFVKHQEVMKWSQPHKSVKELVSASSYLKIDMTPGQSQNLFLMEQVVVSIIYIMQTKISIELTTMVLILKVKQSLKMKSRLKSLTYPTISGQQNFIHFDILSPDTLLNHTTTNNNYIKWSK